MSSFSPHTHVQMFAVTPWGWHLPSSSCGALSCPARESVGQGDSPSSLSCCSSQLLALTSSHEAWFTSITLSYSEPVSGRVFTGPLSPPPASFPESSCLPALCVILLF